jgi:hypothetical protein
LNNFDFTFIYDATFAEKKKKKKRGDDKKKGKAAPLYASTNSNTA